MSRPGQEADPLHAEVRDSIGEVAAALPLPGAGDTARRWRALADIARRDLVVGRLVEAHADADAILHELGAGRPESDQWWGVWASEPPAPRLDAVQAGGTWKLTGGKAWCSGAGMCTHALVTARVGESRNLYAVRLAHPGVTVDLGQWHTAGMRRSATGTVDFDHVPARLVGTSDDYLQRAGFWHGGAGVAACWLGGAEAVADTLRAAATSHPLDEHGLAHLGAVDAALAGARWTLGGAALEVDHDPTDLVTARTRALRVRAVVESAATLVLDRVGRALGPVPLCLDGAHATVVADLEVYLRQSHAERDLAMLATTLSPRADGSG